MKFLGDFKNILIPSHTLHLWFKSYGLKSSPFYIFEGLIPSPLPHTTLSPSSPGTNRATRGISFQEIQTIYRMNCWYVMVHEECAVFIVILSILGNTCWNSGKGHSTQDVPLLFYVDLISWKSGWSKAIGIFVSTPIILARGHWNFYDVSVIT